jgi:hypothetical protein
LNVGVAQRTHRPATGEFRVACLSMTLGRPARGVRAAPTVSE